MTSPVSAVEAIEKAMREAAVNLVDTLVLERETNGQSKEFSDWAVFMTVRAFIEQRVIGARAAEALAERLKLEAQSHAMEARTANSTINEIYQIVSGGKGEPGNWHGAEPVRAKLEALQRENAELRRLVENGQSFANQVRSITYRLNGQAYSSTVSELNQFDAVLRCARTLLKEEANAE
jgi:hypothetical protein